MPLPVYIGTGDARLVRHPKLEKMGTLFFAPHVNSSTRPTLQKSQQHLSFCPYGARWRKVKRCTSQCIHSPRLRHRGETECSGRVTLSDLLGSPRRNFLERSVFRLRNLRLCTQNEATCSLTGGEGGGGLSFTGRGMHIVPGVDE